MRANVRKNQVYLYPVKLEPEQAKILFVCNVPLIASDFHA
jgi:hypothetical protein